MTIWHGARVEEKGIDYAVREVETPSHPHSQQMLAYWEERRQPDGLMPRAAFDPLDMPRLMGGMFVVEPVNGSTDMRYRLVGAENERRLGRKFTGELFTDCYLPDMAADQIALLNRVMNKRKPAFLQGCFLGLDVEHVHYEAIYLPAVDKDGGLQVIGGLFELPAPEK